MAEHTQIHTSETKHDNLILPQLAKITETQKPFLINQAIKNHSQFKGDDNDNDNSNIM